MSEMTLRWARLPELGALELHQIIQAREAVFVVEQQCPYQETDHLDLHAWHLIGHVDGQLAAYLRVVDPGHKYAEPSIGRVLTAQSFRARGLGRPLMTEAIRATHERHPGQAIRISAQSYLLRFYTGLGFVQVGEGYLEDDIPHVEMVKTATLSC